MVITDIVIGKVYRFDNSHNLKPSLRGKIFKVISHSKLQAYNDDGSLVLNPTGEPWFYFGSELRYVDSISIQPLQYINKHSLIHD